MADTKTSYHDDFFKWLKIILADKGLQPTLSGFKSKDLTSQHAVDPATGKWQDPSYSQSKPQRWLFGLRREAGILVAEPAVSGMANIGIHSTGQGKKAAMAVRILPVIEKGAGDFEALGDMEAYAVFAFKDPIEAGGNADPSGFDPATGEMQHRAQGKSAAPQPYIFAGLLGVKPRGFSIYTTVSGIAGDLTYGEVVDALAAAIQVRPEGGALASIPVFDLSDNAELERLTTDIEASYAKAGPPQKKPLVAVGTPGIDDTGDDEEEDVAYAVQGTIEISEHPTLVGIDPSVYRQINAALNSGKQHIMFYGPPGTGKTTLARWVATSLTGTKWTLITGSADWSSQDIIGGYQPVGGGKIKFFPGVLLRDFDRPLIIDELNRCDIDKVIGPLFTVLSGQQTSLPYRIDAEDAESAQYAILPQPKDKAQEHEFAPGRAWRLLATINSIDKASLYQMSYALSRRFGWVYVDVPKDTSGFIRDFFKKETPGWPLPAAGAPCPLGEFWGAINTVRQIGPAPIMDAIGAIRVMVKAPDFFVAPDPAMRTALLDALDMVLLPMLDGIIARDAEELADAAIKAFALEGDEQARIKERMKSVAV